MLFRSMLTSRDFFPVEHVTPGGVEYEVPLPGYGPEDIDASIDKESLIIKSVDGKKKVFLPVPNETDRIDASMKNGLLKIVIERSPPAAKKIEVRAE